MERTPGRSAAADGAGGAATHPHRPGGAVQQRPRTRRGSKSTTWVATELEPLWLQAQSVPSASRVPCVRSLPGWTVAGANARNGWSGFTLDHDRAGERAVVVRLAATCDPAGATEVPSDRPGVRHYQRTERHPGRFAATWYDRFPGGCVTYQLQSTTDIEGTFATEAPLVLGFVTRQALQQALDERSNGRLHLDPAAARNGRRAWTSMASHQLSTPARPTRDSLWTRPAPEYKTSGQLSAACWGVPSWQLRSRVGRPVKRRPARAAQTRSGCSRRRGRLLSAVLTCGVMAGGMTKGMTRPTHGRSTEPWLPSDRDRKVAARRGAHLPTLSPDGRSAAPDRKSGGRDHGRPSLPASVPDVNGPSSTEVDLASVDEVDHERG